MINSYTTDDRFCQALRILGKMKKLKFLKMTKRGLTDDFFRCIIQHVKAKASLRRGSQRRFLHLQNLTGQFDLKGKGVFHVRGKVS